jgi:hypothetical protein
VSLFKDGELMMNPFNLSFVKTGLLNMLGVVKSLILWSQSTHMFIRVNTVKDKLFILKDFCGKGWLDLHFWLLGLVYSICSWQKELFYSSFKRLDLSRLTFDLSLQHYKCSVFFLHILKGFLLICFKKLNFLEESSQYSLIFIMLNFILKFLNLDLISL